MLDDRLHYAIEALVILKGSLSERIDAAGGLLLPLIPEDLVDVEDGPQLLESIQEELMEGDWDQDPERAEEVATQIWTLYQRVWVQRGCA